MAKMIYEDRKRAYASVRLSEAESQKLCDLAQRSGLPKSEILRQGIKVLTTAQIDRAREVEG